MKNSPRLPLQISATIFIIITIIFLFGVFWFWPSSPPNPPPPRSIHYHPEARQLKLEGLRFPVYTKKDLKNPRPMRIDLTITASNKYTRNYLDENGHLARHKLLMEVLPISSEFLLHEEGKAILRKKIQEELNELIRELKIEGHIENVSIHSILLD